MFIDCHAHAYRKRPPAYSFSTAEQVLERYDELGSRRERSCPS